ncbi:MAG: hypothetical protein QOI04_135 [Verrucomicrobiota bacterium]|jgi:hypothetical protein
MKNSLLLSTLFTVALIASPLFAQDQPPNQPNDSAIKQAQDKLPSDAPKTTTTSTSTATSPAAASSAQSGAPDMQQMMAQMIELSKINENHKLLADLDGTWTYTIKFWMSPDPNSKPQESKGTATRKSIFGGRYFAMDVSGKMQMPGPDGKMKDMEFKGMGIEGYDNVKKKFIGSWIDNMGTGIMMSEGTYDAATKTFTYTGEAEVMPGMKEKFREVMKIVDKDHMSFESYSDHGTPGQESKTLEINYTRSKK